MVLELPKLKSKFLFEPFCQKRKVKVTRYADVDNDNLER